jgi:hypothetical protein
MLHKLIRNVWGLGAEGSPETSVHVHPTTPHHIPDDITAVIPSKFTVKSSPLRVYYIQYFLIGTGLTNDTRVYPHSVNNTAGSNNIYLPS